VRLPTLRGLNVANRVACRALETVNIICNDSRAAVLIADRERRVMLMRTRAAAYRSHRRYGYG
jgi:hypothetical protein